MFKKKSKKLKLKGKLGGRPRLFGLVDAPKKSEKAEKVPIPELPKKPLKHKETEEENKTVEQPEKTEQQEHIEEPKNTKNASNLEDFKNDEKQEKVLDNEQETDQNGPKEDEREHIDPLDLDDNLKKFISKKNRTASERAFMRIRERRLQERIQQKKKMTYRERIAELNKHLGDLPVHFDIPRVGPG